MIVKKLKLENIRSYKEAMIDLPLGKTLFEGNIGCGKSTILMAIEFALFGLGSEKGASLLRAGEDEGSVSIVFESNGIEYIARRELKRKKKGNSIQQGDKCALKTADGVEEYSPGELKERILEILDFNEPVDPKAQSWIYRYAIYTPQEEMKTILSFRPDDRMQTLRKAFRTEDYKTAAEHAKALQKEIQKRADLLHELSKDASDVKTEIEGKTKDIVTKNSELDFLQKKEKDFQELLSELKLKRDATAAKQLTLSESIGAITGLQKLIEDKDTERKNASDQLVILSRKIADLKPKIDELETIPDPTEKNLKELRDEIKSTEADERKLRDEQATIGAKVHDYESISESGICPTCDRPADSKEFVARIESKKSELEAAENKAKNCLGQLDQLEELFEKKRNYETGQATLAGYKANLNEHLQNVELWNKTSQEAETALLDATKQLELVKADALKLEQITRDLETLKKDIEEAENEDKKLIAGISGLDKEIIALKNEISDLEQDLRKKQEQKSRASVLNDYQVWIQDFFLPTLELIEQQVMNRIKEDFDLQFQKWFAMLIDDPGKEARIDEEFTPLIQQDGMDQDVSYLSGGEKTSVALAYRLALNNIVSKVAAGAHSNLLILDEPTDGFSKEQLGKVREILDEIKNPQTILVSHESELESFADQVIRISKTNGESRLEQSR